MKGSDCRRVADVRRYGVFSTALALAAFAVTACAPVTSQYAARVTEADAAARAAIQREADISSASLPTNTIGVLPLTISSADTAHAALGFGLSALIAGDMAQSRQLTVVERTRLDAVMRELNFAQSGRVDTSTAPRVGRIIGARRIILGNLRIQPNGAMQYSSRVANAASGKLDASLSGSSTVNQIFDAEKAMVFQLFDALGVPLSPTERRSLERRPTQSLAAFLEYSRGVRAEFNRDFPSAITHYNAAVTIDPAFVEAGDRALLIQGAFPGKVGETSSIERITSLSVDMINRPTPVIIGTGTDAPATSRERLISIIITVGTP